jgi:hypothetical protein
VFASPLLNLAPASGTGPTVAHSGRLIELRDGRIAGTARLALSPDRRTVDISVTLDEPCDVTIEIRRLDLRCRQGEQRAENLLVVEIALCGRSNPGRCAGRRFSLDRRHSFPAFADTEELMRTGIRLSEIRAEAVLGIAAEPAGGVQRGREDPRDYFCERMLSEIDAAECSSTPVAASRHVELATLYARRLREGGRSLAA